MEQDLWLTMSDQHDVFVHKWLADAIPPKAVLQLSHGMAEHILRYDSFAQALVAKGIFVYGHDHRGHGKTGEKNGLLGFFADDNGFERVVEDVKEINEYIHKQYPDTPIYLLGHSMGSFIVRRFVQRFQGQVDGVILSGTGGNPGLMGKIGKKLAKSQVRKLGNRTESQLMNKLTFGSYNKKIPKVETDFDWLTRDQQEIQRYIDDPHCGYVSTAGFFYDLLFGLDIIHKDNEVKKIEKELPFFFISGEQDPVGNYTKGVIGVIKQFRKCGMVDIDYTFYQEGRHELLNEINKQEVINDIIHWLEAKI